MKPPTVEEVRQYADKLGYTGFDAENFVDKHEMIGWVYVPGKDKKAVPITDWKAAVRYWRRMDVKWGRVPQLPQHSEVCDIFAGSDAVETSGVIDDFDVCIACGLHRRLHPKERA